MRAYLTVCLLAGLTTIIIVAISTIDMYIRTGKPEKYWRPCIILIGASIAWGIAFAYYLIH